MAQKEYRLAAVMFTDIVGFSRMMERDETGTLDLLSTHNTLVRETVGAHGGRVIKTIGDAFLCEFSNTVDAVKCAVELQEAAGVHNEAAPKLPLRLRIGVHLGDIHFLEDDAVGDGISVVTRLQSIGKPGRITISQDVYHLVANKVPFAMEHLGTVKLRNLAREIDAYEITVSPLAEVSVDGDELDEQADAVVTPRSSEREPGDSQSRRGPARTLAANLKSDEYADFNELKALVLQEIKRAGRRVSIEEIRDRVPRRSSGLDEALESLADKGFLTRVRRDRGSTDSGQVHRGVDRSDSDRPTKWDKHSWGGDDKDHEREQRSWDRALEAQPPAAGYDPLVEDYKDRAANLAEKEKSGFRSHLISYLGVNAGLFFVWSMSMFGGFPWFLIVLLAWGIGVASHFAGVKDRVRESRELDQSEGLTREQLRIYRKFVKNRSAWRGHLVSNTATGIFLVVLNLMTSPGFMWSLFPVAFMGIGLLSHLPVYKGKERRLTKRLRDLGARIGGRADARRVDGGSRDEPQSGPGAEAAQIRRRLLASIKAMPSGSPLGDDFEPVLDNYVDQIRLLDQKNRELDEIMNGIPLADLQHDLVSLRKRRDEAQSEKVVVEYERSIAQIQKQQSSYNELKGEREILRLRLSSSLNQLKQLEIDVARMKSVSSDEEVASVAMLKDKSQEMSEYLEDLRAGYRELE